MTLSSIRHVLCAVDVTRPALGALRSGLRIAQRFQATCDAVYARDPSPLRLATLLPDLNELVSHVEAEARLISLLQAEGGAHAWGHSIDGRPSSTILAHSGLTRADLIVLGWNHRDARASVAPPSVARRVASQANCSVLTMCGEHSGAGIRSIVTPIDFSNGTAAALRWFAAFARRFDASVHLLNVSLRSPKHPGAMRADAAGALFEAVARLSRAGIAASGEVLVAGSDASQAILERCGTAFDLLIMGAHRSVPEEREAGGVLAQVRDQGRLPVLSVRPSGAQPVFATPSRFEGFSSEGDRYVGTA